MLRKKQIFTHADSLLDIVNFLGNTTNLKISAELKMDRDHPVSNEEDYTKEIFDEVLEILIEKFPFPDKRILKLKIFETKVYNWSLYEPTDEYHESPLRFSINYGECGATLTTFNSHTDTNSESENSNSESENSNFEPENSYFASENSNFESENSDSMDESW